MTTLTQRNWELEEANNHLDTVFDFEVRMRALYDGDMRQTQHYGLERTDTREFLPNTFKKDYQPHKLDHVKNLVRAYHTAVGGIGGLATAWNNAHVVVLRPPAGNTVTINGYEVEPIMMLRAGYDATAVTCRLGVFNYICMNGLFSLDMNKSMVTSINHNSMMNGRIEELARSISGLGSKIGQVYATLGKAATTNVAMADFIRSVYPLPENPSQRTLNTYEDRVTSIINRVVSERRARGLDDPDCYSGNWMVTKLEAYNAVQGYVQHDARRKGNPSGTDRMMKAVDDKFVKRAAALAFNN